MKALVKKYYQEFVDEIDFPTIIYIYETGKVVSYNKQALELIGKPIVNVNRLRAANPELVMTEEMLDNNSTILYSQRFYAGNGVDIEIDFEINSITLADRHLEIVFFEYSFKQVFCREYLKLLPRLSWLDKKYCIMGSNETFRNEQGYFGNEPLPSHIGEFLEEQTTEHLIGECKFLLGSKKPVFNTLQLVKPIRTMSYFCKINCVPIYNKNDTVVGLLTVYMLVFNREEYEQFFSASLRELNILNQMICKTNMIIVSWKKDSTYRLQYVSSNISNLGYTSEDCYSGKVKFNDILSEEVRRVFFRNIYEIEEGPKEGFNQRMQIRKADGSLTWIVVYVGINKRSNRNYLYECFMQEVKSESSVMQNESSRISYIQLPSVTDDMEKEIYNRRDEFCVYYQPIFDGMTGQVIGLEAILRIKGAKSDARDPRDVLTPAEYIALRVPLGVVFVRNAVSDYVKLKKISKVPLQLYLELNTLQMLQPNYVKTLQDVVRAHGVSPKEVVLELKETLAVEDERLMQEVVKEYKAAGFGIMLSNFSGGTFSMRRIRRLGIERVKYDKEVLGEYYEGRLDTNLLADEIGQLHLLGTEVLVDGVETRMQHEFLKARKIHAFLGNYLSVPLSFENVYKRMKEQ